MKRRELIAALVSTGFLAGCFDGTTGPVTTEYGVSRFTASVVPGSVEGDVRELPAVRVFQTSDRKGVSGWQVVFELAGPDGSHTIVEVSTDADGIARLPGWRLGSVPGRYKVIATGEKFGPIPFTAIAAGKIAAVYELKAVGGNPVPTADGLVTEAYYVLYEGGFYNAFYNTPVGEFTIGERAFGTYIGNEGQLNFSMEFFGPGVSSTWSHAGYGIISGSEMILQRGHPLDFDPELFVRR